MTTARVYRAFGEEDRLLYVGCTTQPLQRMREHAKGSPWWPFHTHVIFDAPLARPDARAAEEQAIATEHPRWNVQFRSEVHPEGFIGRHVGRFNTPWLRDEVYAWQMWLRAGRGAA